MLSEEVVEVKQKVKGLEGDLERSRETVGIFEPNYWTKIERLGL